MEKIDVQKNIKEIVHRYTKKEELVNSITHGLGAFLSLLGMGFLLYFAILRKDPWKISSFIVYGLSLFALYLASTLYHSFRKEKIKKIFRVLDHSFIYLLIAGTYTPIILVGLKGHWKYSLLIPIWILAIIGISTKILMNKKMDKIRIFSVSLYLVMGWLAVVTIKPMINSISKGFIFWLVLGGVFYTFGVIFYLIKKIPYHHGIWHLFVLMGSSMHFAGIFIYLR